MTGQTAEAGRRGEGVRSDCHFAVAFTGDGRLVVEIKSKVGTLYGESIRRQVYAILEHFGVTSARVVMEDSGALPFTIAARLECALRRLDPALGECPASGRPAPEYEVERDRFRRSRLYLPGNEPKFMVNAGLHKPDGVILDLEDSVAPSEKDAARIMVRQALRDLDFFGSEKMVRINQLPLGLADLEEVVPYNVHTVLVPKVEHPDQVRAVDAKIGDILERRGARRDVFIMPIIESAAGVLRALDIALASPRNVALTVGLEDFTADIGAERTQEGRESFAARSIVVMAARAAGLQAIDTVYSDVANEEGLRQSAAESRAMGFEGRGCIHPRQIQPIHEAFAPRPEEVEKAKKVVEAMERAKASGSGVASLGTKMIDPPVAKRAERTLRMARLLGMPV